MKEQQVRKLVREELQQLNEKAVTRRTLITLLNNSNVVGAAEVDSHEIMLSLDDGTDISLRAESDGIVPYIGS